MSTENMGIWSLVEKTPTTAIRAAKVDGQQLTSLHHMHTVRKATEIFGPIGIGWGYEITEERFDQGAPYQDAKTGEVIAHELIHTVILTVWYSWNGSTGRVSNYGHTRYVYRTRDGRFITDGEAPKKSVSDALKKCFSMLGFSADVYEGKFDDQEYTSTRNAETRIEVAEDQEAAIEEAREEYAAWIKKQCETLREKIPHRSSIGLIYNKAMQRIEDKARVAQVDPAKGAAMIEKAANDGVERINKQKGDVEDGSSAE